MAESGKKRAYSISFKDQKASPKKVNGEPNAPSQPLPVKTIATGFCSGFIKVRCTYKGMEKSRNKNDYLVVTFMDDHLEEIRGVAWNKESFRFEQLFEVDQVYNISCFMVDQTSISMSRIELPISIQFNFKTKVVKQDDGSFPSFCAKYISVAAVSEKIERSMLDVVGLVSDDTLTTNKYGDEINQLTIIDEMGGKLLINTSKRIQHFKLNPVTSYSTILGIQGIRYTSKVDFEAEMMQDTIITAFPSGPLAKNLQMWMEEDQEEINQSHENGEIKEKQQTEVKSDNEEQVKTVLIKQEEEESIEKVDAATKTA